MTILISAFTQVLFQLFFKWLLKYFDDNISAPKSPRNNPGNDYIEREGVKE